MQGKFITLEGIEGSGKSTNLDVIMEYLNQHKVECKLTREPGGGPLGPNLRSILLDKDKSISPSVEMLLMMADRKDHVDSLISPNLNQGKWVISDRYLDSTFAYQGGGRKMDMQIIDNLSKQLDLPSPDLTLLFDLPVDIALSRAKERSELDRFEKEPLHFHQRIRDAYLVLADKNKERFRIVDSSKTMTEVSQQVISFLNEFLND